MSRRIIALVGLVALAVGIWVYQRPRADERYAAAIDHTVPLKAEPSTAVSNERTTEDAAPQTPAASSGAMAARVFGADGPVSLDDIPPSRFRDRLLTLPEAAQQRALRKLGDLRVPLNDVGSLSVDQKGNLFYQC